MSPSRLGSASLAGLLAAACAAEAPPPAEAPSALIRKDDDAIALVLVVEGATGSAEDERSGAERAFRDRLDASSRFVLQSAANDAGAAPLHLRLTVGGVEMGEAGMSQKLVLTGALHDGACQVFQFAPVLTKPGAKPGDAAARSELLDTGLGDLIAKLEASSAKLGNATCLATGAVR